MKELGEALRRWRDGVSPREAGLPERGPRRAPGLRREELAMLAGISVDYITRLEQSRATAPSVQVLTALARALRLSDSQRTHLFLLAGQAQPDPGLVPTHITPSLHRLLDQLTGTAITVSDAAWNQVTWNPLWAALFGEPQAPRGHNRNTIWRQFTDQPTRVRMTPEDTARFELGAVADLRATTARFPADPGLRSLVADLRAVSQRFAELWDTHAVGRYEMSTKTLLHPEVGLITLDCDILTLSGSDLRICAYTAPPGSEAADKLRLLEVIGTQAMA